MVWEGGVWAAYRKYSECKIFIMLSEVLAFLIHNRNVLKASQTIFIYIYICMYKTKAGCKAIYTRKKCQPKLNEIKIVSGIFTVLKYHIFCSTNQIWRNLIIFF